MIRRLLAGLCLILLLAEGALPSLLAVHAAPAARAGDATDAEDWPCRHHDCGCKTREQCLTDCCCFRPTSCCHHEAETPAADPAASFWNRLACRGVTGTDFGMGLRPFVPSAAPTRETPAPEARWLLPEPAEALPRRAVAPFHPPRASAS